MDQAPLYVEIADGPSIGHAYWIETEDGVRLRLAQWATVDESVGTVFLLPGRSEFIEMWERTATEFEHRGYSTIVIDWRGQGLSDRPGDDRKLGHVENFSEYQHDLKALFAAAEKLNAPKPWHMVGHSMGATIGIRGLLNEIPIDGCALSAPMLEIPMTGIERTAATPLIWLYEAIGLKHSYAPGYDERSYFQQKIDFERNRLTTDQSIYEHWQDLADSHPDLQLGGPSIGWLRSALEEVSDIIESPRPSTPCLVYWGDQDIVVGLNGIKFQMDGWNNSRLEVIANAKHELLGERPSVRNMLLDEITNHFRSLEQ